MDRATEIHVTEVHTRNSGDVKFPDWDKTNWTNEEVEIVEVASDNEFRTTYSIWTKS